MISSMQNFPDKRLIKILPRGEHFTLRKVFRIYSAALNRRNEKIVLLTDNKVSKFELSI